eukprot:1514791-Rhodomonas_salina.2
MSPPLSLPLSFLAASLRSLPLRFSGGGAASPAPDRGHGCCRLRPPRVEECSHSIWREDTGRGGGEGEGGH